MADITMCRGIGCPQKEQCYRYTAEACEYRQSYFLNTPYEGDKCDLFWPNREESSDD